MIGTGALEADDIFDRLPALGPTIDIIAEEDEAHGSAGRIVDTAIDQSLELGETAVDVADAVNKGHAAIRRLKCWDFDGGGGGFAPPPRAFGARPLSGQPRVPA